MYTRYRFARLHPLFGVLVLAGIATTLALIALSLWGTAELMAAAMQGQNLKRRERGVLYFLAFVVTLPVIWWLTRAWWRAVHRLPRRFEYECETCRWSGPCAVVGGQG